MVTQIFIQLDTWTVNLIADGVSLLKVKKLKIDPHILKKAPIHLEYELSPEQKELSDKLVDNYKKGIDSLVYAVCGSPKTQKT